MSPSSGTGANTAERVPSTRRAVAAEGAAPGDQPLMVGEPGVQHRHRRVEALAEPRHQLRRQPDLRHQHQRPPPRGEHALDQPQVDLRLAAAGDAVQHEAAEGPQRGRRSSPSRRLLRVRLQAGRTCRGMRTARRPQASLRAASQPRAVSARAASRQPGASRRALRRGPAAAARAARSAAGGEPAAARPACAAGLRPSRPSALRSPRGAPPAAGLSAARPRPLRRAGGGSSPLPSPAVQGRRGRGSAARPESRGPASAAPGEARMRRRSPSRSR